MYCRKCGRAIEEGDAFCTNCGTPVPAEELVSRRMNTAAHNPEFKWDVREEFPEPKKRETMVFNWADGSMTPVSRDAGSEPAAEPSFRTPEPEPVTEPSVREPEPAAEPLPVETEPTRVFTVPEEPTVAPYAAPTDTLVREPYETAELPRETAPAPSDTTEREIFRDIERADEEAVRRRDDRFYTFTRKNEEFQRLLDREYERIRRNGTPVERPLRMDSPLFPEEPAPVVRAPEPAPVTPVPAAPEPVRPASSGDTIAFTPVSERSAAVRPTAPVEPQPAPAAPAAPVVPAPAPAKARPEPTYRTDPDEIRTIWEEIKADMERENAERIAKAAEAERVAKMSAEADRTESAGRRVGVVSRKELLRPDETATRRPSEEAADRSAASREASYVPGGRASRDTGEVAAVTATALTKIWENGDDDEDDEPKRKGRFWLWFFLIILLLLLAVLAIFVVQTFWPDTPAADFCADAEVWLKDAWAAVSDFFTNLFGK